MIARIASIVVLLLSFAAAQAQQFGAAEFPIKDDDGDPIANHSLTAEQMAKVARLPGLVDVGDAIDDVTLYQFYDLNCPFCREAAADVDRLIRTDSALRLVFVPYPVLSAASVEGARVELAVRELASPQKFLEFHRRIYAGRGVIDGARALAVTREMSLDQNKIVEIANAQRVTDTMTRHAKVGSALKLVATPAYVIQGVAILGHPGFEPLRKIIAAVRTCKKVVC
ncbi:MAG TPA: DsbA family protein [Xanthobacteraceae bacterium]|jgi:protein-disulfide isomerase|nr:DsbA family protein [Xanthobacteraceae bacterium]